MHAMTCLWREPLPSAVLLRRSHPSVLVRRADHGRARFSKSIKDSDPMVGWLIFVAWPLWRTGTLAGSPSEELANVFLGTPILVAIVPWGYVYRTYVKWPSRTPARIGRQA